MFVSLRLEEDFVISTPAISDENTTKNHTVRVGTIPLS